MNLIAKITDEDFEQELIKFNNPEIRYGARGILQRSDGRIAIFNKINKNEYKLPGGGIDKNETPEQAFRREILEETGCEIIEVKEIGITEELRSKANFQQISYVFISKLKKQTNKLHLTEKEKSEGGQLIWLYPQEALEKIENSLEKLKESKYENMYHSKFINYRDKAILNFYINNFIQ